MQKTYIADWIFDFQEERIHEKDRRILSELRVGNYKKEGSLGRYLHLVQGAEL